MGSEQWGLRTQVDSGLALGWVHTGPFCPSPCPQALLFSVPRTAAPVCRARGSGAGVGRGLRSIPGDAMESAVGNCNSLSLVCGGTNGMVPGVFQSAPLPGSIEKEAT